MPSKKPTPTDWKQVQGVVDGIYRDYAQHLAESAWPVPFVVEGRGWVATITIEKKYPLSSVASSSSIEQAG